MPREKCHSRPARTKLVIIIIQRRDKGIQDSKAIKKACIFNFITVNCRYNPY